MARESQDGSMEDLYEEGCAQPDGGLLTDADDEQADDEQANGQTLVEFCSGLFQELPAPLLPIPESPPPRATLPRAGKLRKRKALQATRSSLRQAAKSSAVPVAERAQRKLMRELEFLNPQRRAPDAAITDYIDLYGANLPDQAVNALRAATRLDSKELTKALAAIAAEYDATEMETE